MTRPYLDAIEAAASSGVKPSALETLALVAYVRELEAAQANERGEGEPPSEGWEFRNGDGSDPYDVGYVPDSTGRRWTHPRAGAWEVRGKAGAFWTWLIDGNGGDSTSARAAMLAADAALKGR